MRCDNVLASLEESCSIFPRVDYYYVAAWWDRKNFEQRVVLLYFHGNVQRQSGEKAPDRYAPLLQYTPKEGYIPRSL